MKRILLHILTALAIVLTGSCEKNDDIAPAVLPKGALAGVFTVADFDGIPNSGDETKVYFSKGNLTYDVSTTTWAFYEHQYDCATNGSASSTCR